MRKLPPLNALRAFEAVVRHGGVSKAGNALFVSHGAISRHIKLLETWLEVSLFQRSGRQLELTENGQWFFEQVSQAFSQLREATQRLVKPGTIKVVTTHSLASCWLAECLAEFGSAHPKLETWLMVDQQLTDLNKSSIDVAVRMGAGPWPQLLCTPLLEDRLVPVCSPAFAENRGPFKSPADLTKAPLLHDCDPNAQWSRWAAEHHVSGLNLTAGPRYTSSDILIRAAMAGQGVALVSEFMAGKDLQDQRLIQALPHQVDLGPYLWLVMPEGQSSAEVLTLCDWLISKTKC